MNEQNKVTYMPQKSSKGQISTVFNGGLWSVGALIIALVVVAPICSVVYMAFFPNENIWPHLVATTLPRYLTTTLNLMIYVGLLSALIGTGAAWLISRYTFWGAKWLEWALLMPLAIPAYVGAYALVDFLEYAGPVQTGLRDIMGWTNSRDYWFPQIRSFPAAVFVLSMSLYPYVYLLTRAAFREQSGSAEEVARSLGAKSIVRFFRIGLPLARPAIAAGVAIVMMETVNDFGTVDYFAVQTLTTGIFNVWLQSSNAGGAAQLACVILTMVIVLVSLEKVSRRKMRFFNLSTKHRPIEKEALKGGQSLFACLACIIPVGFGFVLPVAVLGSHAFAHPESFFSDALWQALGNTVFLGACAALITVLAAVFMVYSVRQTGRILPRYLLPVTTIGYAAPGAVLGVGILIPLAAIDNKIADFFEYKLGYDSGLILTGTSFAIVLAYCLRFFAIAQGAADTAMGRISPNLARAARSLGRGKKGVLLFVYAPLIKGSIGSALLLVFVDCVKELPATLLLRPFNYDTLATRVHEQASLENLPQAAPAAIFISLVGLVAVLALARANK